MDDKKKKTAGEKQSGAAGAVSDIDRLYLRNGDRISGTIINMFSGKLTLTAYGNKAIEIPWADVVSLETARPYRACLTKGSSLDGKIRTVSVPENSEGGAVVSSGEFPTATAAVEVITQLGAIRVTVADIVSIDNFPDIEKKRLADEEAKRFSLGNVWSGKLSLGLVNNTGNAQSNNLHVDIEATRKTCADKLFLDAHFDRAETEGVTSADNFRGGMRLDVNISKQQFYFLFSRVETDKVQDLDLRTTIGAGMGRTLYDYVRGHLDIGAGFTWVRDTFEDTDETSDLTALVSMNWNRTLAGSTSFKERLLYYPRFDDMGDFRVESDTTFDYLLSNDISLSLGIINRYDSEPVAGNENLDTRITTTITKKY